MYASVQQEQAKSASNCIHCDAVIVGAGPYGLSLAAHLTRQQLKVAIFGKPFGLWLDGMYNGMHLRSHWKASTLSDPDNRYGLEQYLQQHALPAPNSLSRTLFINYGLWFHQQVVPFVDETYVSSITKLASGFDVVLEDDRRVITQVVIMATGLAPYAFVPPEYAQLPANRISHTSQHRSFEAFQEQRVAVIGGGPSALETAAFLHEEGASVHLITRHAILWDSPNPTPSKIVAPEDMRKRSLWQRIRYPNARLSPGLFNWWIENFPYMFHYLPNLIKKKLFKGKGGYKPASPQQLKARLIGHVTLHEGYRVQHIQNTEHGVQITLSDQTVCEVDHILLGTGYIVNVRNEKLLAPEIRADIKTTPDGAPLLNGYFESSVKGLYFVGPASVASFGPLYRFVIGTDATARRITAHINRRLKTRTLS